MLKVGDKAPDFSLPDSDMQIRELSDFLDKFLVLYFYPKDDTPGCTLQANEFSELVDAFEEIGGCVVGISQDDCFSHQAFRDKYGLKVVLLADADAEACSSYGVLREKEKDGAKIVSVLRSTFVVDRAQKICFARYGVSPGHHAQEMLEVMKKLSSP